MYAVWYKCATSSSQPCISQYRRPSRFYLVRDTEMLRWYLTAAGLTTFNQSLADQDLSGLLLNLPAQYRVISIINTINSVQTSCFFVLHNLNSISFITDGGGSDFLSSQILASSEQISFFSNFLWNARFWFSSHI